ncbi:MAG: hypothetical protein ABI068_01220, partial [Ktedonobacterales bacterium]
QFADVKFGLGLENTVFPRQSVPQMAWLSWFQLIYFAVILVFWVVLLRFKIIPRDPFGTRAQAQTRMSGGSASGGKKAAPADQIPGIGVRRPRAARRHATTATPAKAQGIESHPATPRRSLLAMDWLPGKARSAASQPAAPATAVKAPAPQVAISSGHDATYERVKAAQRQRRRHSAKR